MDLGKFNNQKVGECGVDVQGSMFKVEKFRTLKRSLIDTWKKLTKAGNKG
jgi:hypothetical protein